MSLWISTITRLFSSFLGIFCIYKINTKNAQLPNLIYFVVDEFKIVFEKKNWSVKMNKIFKIVKILYDKLLQIGKTITTVPHLLHNQIIC